MPEVTTKSKVTGPRAVVLKTLEEFGGEIRDADGGATHILYEGMGRDISEKALANSLKKMEDAGLIEREVRGKRTYGIWLPSLPQMRDVRVPDREQGPADVRSVRADVPTPSGPDYAALASALLERVGEILANGDGGELKARLGEQVTRTQSLTAKVMELGEELVAVKHERNGLRERLRACEANVERVVKGGPVPDTRAFKALERFMQEKPKGRG